MRIGRLLWTLVATSCASAPLAPIALDCERSVAAERAPAPEGHIRPGVTVLGAVERPADYALTPGETAGDAITSARPTVLAHLTRVVLTRSCRGSTWRRVIDMRAVHEGRAPDVLLEHGDILFVPTSED
jgi:hypothetical protein